MRQQVALRDRGSAMRLQLTTASFSFYSLNRTFALARQVGVDSIELALTARVMRAGIEPVRAVAARHDMRIRSVLLGAPPTFPPERSALTADARFVRELPDCETVILPQAPAGAPVVSHLRAIHAYREAFGTAARHLAMENPAPARRESAIGALDHFAQFRRVAEEWDLNFTYDVSAGAEQRWVITEPLVAMGQRLRNVHFSDFRVSTELLAQRDGYGRLLPGAGMLPLRAFLRALARREYGGLLTLDVHPKALGAWWPPTVKNRLAAAVAYCRTAYAEGPAPAPAPPRVARIEEPAEAENESL